MLLRRSGYRGRSGAFRRSAVSCSPRMELRIEHLLLVVALLLFASILASKTSGRLGVPTLLLFLLWCAGMASMLRFVVGLAPVTLTAMQLLSRRWWLFIPTLGLILVGGWFGTIGWLTGVLTLV